jgi:dCTP deaminase
MTNNNVTLFPELERDLAAFYTTGVLPAQSIEDLVAAGHVTSKTPIEPDQIQPASIDLRLGHVGYRVRASFLPRASSGVTRKLDDFKCHEVDLTNGAVFETGCVYIVPLQEEVSLSPQISAKGNPKSSIGRLDVFTRLMTEWGPEFERVPAGYKGRLYLEIVPRTFGIIVSQGARMHQLRFMRGNPKPSDAKLKELHERDSLVFRDGQPTEAVIGNGLKISLDLAGVDDSGLIGYEAKRNAPLIDLSRLDFYDAGEFWEPIHRPRSRQIILDPERFYLLISKEQVCILPSQAAELVPYDPAVGEFRIHYAGFFDPGFGYSPGGESKGTHAVLEVRAHDVPFLVEDGQIVGRLVYERLLAPPTKVYGPDIGSSYQDQRLSLSKFFKRPEQMNGGG